jgi:hypothetical protein
MNESKNGLLNGYFGVFWGGWWHEISGNPSHSRGFKEGFEVFRQAFPRDAGFVRMD